MARLDIVFVHDVIPALHGDAFEQRFAEAMEGAIPALLRLKRQGAIGAIGTALRDPAVHLRFALAAPCDVFMLAGSYTLLDQSGADAFLPHCARSGQRVLLASPFETGLLATGAHAGARFRHKPATPELLARTAAIQAACARHGVPLAAAALQFPLRHPAVASVVVGHQTPEEMARNLALLSEPIPDALWSELGF
jgi:D-threo-aldose 1-dehydrogenase